MIEELLCEMLEAARARIDGRPVILGLCGAQGSGKSTVSRRLVERLQARGLAAAALSLDDLYLTRAERQALADKVHPLLRTRGVPGTHDVALGERVLDQIKEQRLVRLPAFNKATDDRRAEADWPVVQAPLDVVLFEGWCVGARPQAQAELSEPINALERDHDPTGAWRAFANAQLAGPYQRLFARIDVLALLAAPDFSVVEDWRGQQEAELRDRLRREGAATDHSLDAGQVAVFIQHFQRITEHILSEMPSRADVVFRLGHAREVLAVERPSRPPE